jgi:hypothetical protein
VLDRHSLANKAIEYFAKNYTSPPATDGTKATITALTTAKPSLAAQLDEAVANSLATYEEVLAKLLIEGDASIKAKKKMSDIMTNRWENMTQSERDAQVASAQTARIAAKAAKDKAAAKS